MIESQRAQVELGPTAIRSTPVSSRTRTLFENSQAFREGHFRLSSGLHSSRYLEKFQVLQYPEFVVELCGFMANLVRDRDGHPTVDLVVGPTTGGVLLAFEVARQLGVRGIFAEKAAGPDGEVRREFRRGFRIGPTERVFLVDDILTTGSSLQPMVPAIESTGANLVMAAVMVDRAAGRVTLKSGLGLDYRVDALWTLDVPTYEAGPATCPACAAALPLIAPGSTGTKPA